MNIYKVSNGYTGNSEVYLVVIAESGTQAEMIARQEFRRFSEIYNHPESYWTGLGVDFISHFENEAQVLWGSDE